MAVTVKPRAKATISTSDKDVAARERDVDSTTHNPNSESKTA